MSTSALSGAQRSEPLGEPDDVAGGTSTETDMPFKSQAQRRKFAQLLVGGLTPALFETLATARVQSPPDAKPNNSIESWITRERACR
jgi:hypothetical protein